MILGIVKQIPRSTIITFLSTVIIILMAQVSIILTIIMIFIPETGQLQSQIKRRDRARLMPSNYWLRTISMLRLRTIWIGDRTIRRKKKKLKIRSLVEGKK